MKTLQDYVNAKQTVLFEKMGVIFAFSSKDFLEQREENVTYVSFGAGCYLPKANYDEFSGELEKIQIAGREQDMAENGREGIIRRELNNFECFYTGSYEDAYEALKPYDITRSEIESLFFSKSSTA